MARSRNEVMSEWRDYKRRIAEIKSRSATELARSVGVKEIIFHPAVWTKVERQKFTIVFDDHSRLEIRAEPDPTGPWLGDNWDEQVNEETQPYWNRIEELAEEAKELGLVI